MPVVYFPKYADVRGFCDDVIAGRKELAAFLTGCGMEEHIAEFTKNKISDVDMLDEIDAAEYAEMAVPIGDRKDLAKARQKMVNLLTPEYARRLVMGCSGALVDGVRSTPSVSSREASYAAFSLY